jgi:GAF domain-containing protein
MESAMTRSFSKQWLEEAEDEQRELVCHVTRDQSFVGTRIPWGQGVVGFVAMTLKPLNIRDAYTEPRFNRESDIKTGFTTKAILTVPVTDRDGRALGVIQAVNKLGPPGYFDDDDLVNLMSIATSAGVVLRKSLLYRAALAGERRSRALLDLLHVTSSDSSSLADVIDGIVKVAYKMLEADRVTIFFVDKDKVFSVVSQDATGWSIPLGKGIAGYVAQTGRTMNIPDAYDSPLFDKSVDLNTHYRTKSVLCMPVKDEEGKVLAVVQALNKKVAGLPADARGPLEAQRARELEDLFIPFTTEDQLLLEALCVQMRSTVRRLHVEARVAAMPAGEAAATFGSLLDLYSDRNSGGRPIFLSRARSTALGLSRARGSIDATVAGAASASPPAAALPPSASATSAGTTASFAPSAAATRGGDDSATAVVGAAAAAAAAAGGGEDQLQLLTLVWPVLPQFKAELEDLQSLDFDVWRFSDDELMVLVMRVFHELAIAEKLACDVATLQNFVMAARRKYNERNPFHNWRHGFSVFHFSYIMVKRTHVGEWLQENDVICLLLSSLMHDVDHPGNTNTYEVNKESRLALLHNDIAVLENHHAYTTFLILRDKRCDLFKNLKRQQRQAMRTSIIEAILATDMTVHFEACRKLGGRDPSNPFNAADARERQQVVNTLIHTADLSGQVWPLSVSAKWEAAITEEFKAQAAKEERDGLPVAPFMQGLKDAPTRFSLQVNFIDFILVPWWEIVVRMLPGIAACHENLLRNREHYQELAGKAPKRDAQPPAAPAPAPAPAPAASTAPEPKQRSGSPPPVLGRTEDVEEADDDDDLPNDDDDDN